MGSNPRSGVDLRKWYFTTNANGLRGAFDQIKVAVLSCHATTQLAPHCLVDDSGGAEDIETKIRWLVDHGVSIVRHQAAMLDVLRPEFGEIMKIYSGHWLRCDIPSVEVEDEFVLYTDIDVIFRNALPKIIQAPLYLACGPEHHRDDYTYFNSGVMIMNVPALRGRLQDLRQVVERRLPVTEPWDDQRALNELFEGEWDRLSPLWNWKPYWGRADDALIVHFHGPKPGHARRMLSGDLDPLGSPFRTIFERNPAGYAYYVELFQTLLASR